MRQTERDYVFIYMSQFTFRLSRKSNMLTTRYKNMDEAISRTVRSSSPSVQRQYEAK